jgi:hypothetical protein
VDRMAAPSWVAGRTAAEAAMDGHQQAAATAWARGPMRSMAVGLDMTIVARIGTAITTTPIGTATGPILRTAALAGGGLQRGACGCAATSAHIGTAITNTHIGMAIVRMADTAIIVRTAAIMVRPTDAVPPTDTDAGKVVAEQDNAAQTALRHAVPGSLFRESDSADRSVLPAFGRASGRRGNALRNLGPSRTRVITSITSFTSRTASPLPPHPAETSRITTAPHWRQLSSLGGAPSPRAQGKT